MILRNQKKIRVHVTGVTWSGEELAPSYYVTLGVNKYILMDGIKNKVKDYLNSRNDKSKVVSFNIKDVKDVK